MRVPTNACPSQNPNPTRTRFSRTNPQVDQLRTAIDALAYSTIQSAGSAVAEALSFHKDLPPPLRCFELFGFDVLVDRGLRPWLLEASQPNLAPNLSPKHGSEPLSSVPCEVNSKPGLHGSAGHTEQSVLGTHFEVRRPARPEKPDLEPGPWTLKVDIEPCT